MELLITRLGAKLAVKDKMFEVSYFDDDRLLQHEMYSPLKITSLWVQDGATITVAAHLLAWEHTIDVLLLDSFGMPQVCCIGFELHSSPSVQKAQVIASQSKFAVATVKNWISAKLQNQASFLEKLKSRRDDKKKHLLDTRAKEINTLRKQVLALDGKQVRDIAEQLRGFEGAASRVYFQTLSELLSDEYRFNGRSRQPAHDAFNAFLNYGYAILYSKADRALRMAGLNPFIGFFHADGHRHKSMLFDFVEPFRIWVDAVVFRLFSRKMVMSNHTRPLHEGVQLDKDGIKLLAESFREYLDEKKEEWDSKIVSREHLLRQAAYRFARRSLTAAEMSDAEDASDFDYALARA